MKYICVEGFAVEMFDDDGFSEDEYTTVEVGDEYELSESPFRIVGRSDSVRLEGRDGNWLELTQEHFARYFAPEKEVSE